MVANKYQWFVSGVSAVWPEWQHSPDRCQPAVWDALCVSWREIQNVAYLAELL